MLLQKGKISHSGLEAMLLNRTLIFYSNEEITASELVTVVTLSLAIPLNEADVDTDDGDATIEERKIRKDGKVPHFIQ